MSDWQVGDLAVCVEDGPCQCCGDPTGLVRGVIYTVILVDDIPPYGIYLSVAEIPNIATPSHNTGNSFDEHAFRKIRPDEHQACEEEFVTLLRRSKVPETADGYDYFIRGGCPGVSGTVETRLGTVVRIVRRGAK